MQFQQYLAQIQARVDHLLDQYLPASKQSPERLHSAMRYSAQNPGKRLRPALVYAVGEMLGADEASLGSAAIAVELIHAYSLIHDDLPCMDDDDLRRGIPTCHIAFDEATAVLAGDALQTLAFEILSSDPRLKVSDKVRLQMLSLLSRASGSLGMGGGQAIDLAMTDQKGDLQTLQAMHRMKTGALIDCAVQFGYLVAQRDEPQVQKALSIYSSHLGLAFQIRDDILDIEGETSQLGKPQGSDLAKNKLTFPALLGLEGAKAHARKQVDAALAALEQIPYNSEQLAEFAHFIIQRNF